MPIAILRFQQMMLFLGLFWPPACRGQRRLQFSRLFIMSLILEPLGRHLLDSRFTKAELAFPLRSDLSVTGSETVVTREVAIDAARIREELLREAWTVAAQKNGGDSSSRV